jgi:hypothetical protein
MKQVVTIGLDLAKRAFQVHGADAYGNPIVIQTLRRPDLLSFFKRLPSCLVGIPKRERPFGPMRNQRDFLISWRSGLRFESADGVGGPS